MKKYLTILIIVTMGACGLTKQSQSKLTEKQILERNYQEVIGELKCDTITPPDKFAMYPNGLQGIFNHIAKHTRYPQKARLNEIEGTVILRFVVEKDGSVKEIEVVQSVDKELDAEAIRVLKKLETWVPGYKNGEPVRVEYRQPFRFRLK